MKNRFIMGCLFFAASFCAAQTPADSSYRQEGIASWYGTEFEGRPTASGELFDPNQFTAAHPDLPFGTLLIVTNALNGEQVFVRVNDRGPFVKTRIIDVSKAAAEKLNMLETGTAQVIVELAPRNVNAANTPAQAQPPNQNTPATQPAVTAQQIPPVQPQVNQNVPAASQPAVTAQQISPPVQPQPDPNALASQPVATAQQIAPVQPQPNENIPASQPAVTAQQIAPVQPQANQNVPAASQPAVTAQRTPPPQPRGGQNTRTSQATSTQRTANSPGAATGTSRSQPNSTPAARPPASSSPVARPPATAPQTRSSGTGASRPAAPSYTPQQPAIRQSPASPQTESVRAPQSSASQNRASSANAPVASFQPVPTIARPPVATTTPSMPNSAIAPSIPPGPVQPPPRVYPTYTTAEIVGGPFVSGRYYRLQIGSFKVAKNAVEVFDRLSAAGLNPQWEPYGELYRVVISNVRADEINSIAVKLGSAGFKEAIAREER
ncbi:MAG: septal ring lytic transglycosylase RlpA family protein [Spirochaetaceae bacterium]|nr:septal ring lytic transglycosylase RlpA family protein [Spirochaetaceae bacterium]